MRFVLVLVLALVCGTSVATPDQGLADWHALKPTWGTWRTQRRTIPHERERAMARALLRGGNFGCAAAKKVPASCFGTIPLKPPAASAGFDDPCFRYVLATWSLRMLSEDEIDAIRDDLLPLAQLPLEEWSVLGDIIERIARVDPEHAVPMLEAVGRRKLIYRLSFEHEVERVSPASQQRLRAAHMYKDILSYDVNRELDWMLEEANDQSFDDEERVWAIRRSFEAKDKMKVKAAFHQLAGDPNCKVAMAAAVHLAMLGDRSMLPAKGARDRTRAICLANQDVSYYTVGTTFGQEVDAVLASYGVSRTKVDRYAGCELNSARRLDDFDFDLMDAP